MLTDFVSLLQLFAGLGISAYFLVEDEVSRRLFGSSVIASLVKSANIEENTLNDQEVRDASNPDDLLEAIDKNLEGPNPEKTIKRSILLFRYDSLNTSIYCILLMILAIFEGDISNNQFIINLGINFSILLIILHFDRSRGKAPQTDPHLSLWEEILKVLFVFLSCLVISILVQAQFPELWFRISFSTVIILPILLFGLRYRNFRRRFLNYKLQKKPASQVQSDND